MNTTATHSNVRVQSSKRLHALLWITQLLLGLAFAAVGFMKLTQPIAVLAANMGWPGDVPAALVRFIGTCELVGAFGLILPAATRITPVLTPLAGAGLATIMVLAIAFHLSRGEPGALPVLIVVGGLAALVAWGRWKKAPIAAR
jgi:uncharacterized membrane protein YphA (DoxX/SURF4 family)